MKEPEMVRLNYTSTNIPPEFFFILGLCKELRLYGQNSRPETFEIKNKRSDLITAVVEFYLLGYNAVQSVESQPTFRRSTACYLLYAGFLLGLFFDLEDGGDMLLRNIG
jgi:hypothetical protein